MLSVYVAAQACEPAVAVDAEQPHRAAGTLKIAVLAALYRSDVDLDAPVAIPDSFASVVAGRRFRNDPAMDSDPELWRLVGQTATLRMLADRMITRSSNVATNVCLEHVGLDRVAEVWRLAGARGSVTGRGIEDYVADPACATAPGS